MNQQEQLIPHLFRSEYSKIVAVLGRRFGFGQMEIAEDIASDTFLAATQSWPVNGTPPNPVAWLYNVAKNKAKNYLQRNQIYENKIAPELQSSFDIIHESEIDLSPQNINDSQLQMMFAVCSPLIPAEAQIGLALRILCGFGIQEIAEAFLTNKETINKRLFRAKEKLRDEKIKIAFPGSAEIDHRLDNVLTTLYLLFSEGYYSVSQNQVIRKELCFEAIRLCTMLVEHSHTDRPRTNALLALMYFQASRVEARIDKNGEIVLYDEQEVGLWDGGMIGKGGYFLNRATSGDKLSKYHLEAAIAYWSTQKADTPEKWETILQLYNRLLQIEYSPIAALNRTYALAKANSKAEAIVEAEKLKLTGSHFYYVLLGELYTDIDNNEARSNLEIALSKAKTGTDKQTIRKKMEKLEQKMP
jgi:RNA polymerase sigma factor (sigma-70 family)